MKCATSTKAHICKGRRPRSVCSLIRSFSFHQKESSGKQICSHMCSLVVLGIGQNFIVDHQFCKTDWPSINNRCIENIYTLNLGTYSLLHFNKRGIQIIFFLFLYENMLWVFTLWGTSNEYPQHMCWPWWLSWMRIWQVIRRLRVRSWPGWQHSFLEIWSWNIFCGHSLSSADSRRAVVSFWLKNVHITG